MAAHQRNIHYDVDIDTSELTTSHKPDKSTSILFDHLMCQDLPSLRYIAVSPANIVRVSSLLSLY